MVRAKTTILVKDTTYKAGQTVKGLSKIDTQWMREAGYIEEVREDKKTEENKKTEVEKNGV